MKKNLWLLGAAVAALTSCTQSEVLDVPESRQIGFDTFVDKPTRASNDVLDGSTAAFKEFYVYAKKGTKDNTDSFQADGEFVLNQQAVTGGKGSWTYDPHATWISERYYRFAAYANGNGDGSVSAAKLSNDVTITFNPGTTLAEKDWGLTIDNYEVSEGRDLVVAIPNEKYTGDLTTDPGSINLHFKHVLAKVEFRFYYTPAVAGQYLEIDAFGFDAATTGDCVTKYTGNDNEVGASWTPDIFTQDDHQDYYFFDGVGDDGKLESGNIHEAHYVIPQPNAGIYVPAITVRTMNSQDQVESTQTFTNVSLEVPTDGHTSWKPGYVYRYEAILSGKQHEIHFTTSVKTWDETVDVVPVQ